MDEGYLIPNEESFPWAETLQHFFEMSERDCWIVGLTQGQKIGDDSDAE